MQGLREAVPGQGEESPLPGLQLDRRERAVKETLSSRAHPLYPFFSMREGMTGASWARVGHYRIFRDANPIKARMPETIQKRTVILVSETPIYWKQSWTGAR